MESGPLLSNLSIFKLVKPNLIGFVFISFIEVWFSVRRYTITLAGIRSFILRIKWSNTIFSYIIIKRFILACIPFTITIDIQKRHPVTIIVNSIISSLINTVHLHHHQFRLVHFPDFQDKRNHT